MKRLTQQALLELCFLSSSSVGSLRAWERGERLPDLETLCRMAEIFECDVGYLLGDYDERTRTVADTRQTTGLSEAAVETLIGLHEYGPTQAFEALEQILENEDAWRFLGDGMHLTKGANLLHAIGGYLALNKTVETSAFYASNEHGAITLEDSDYLRFVPANSIYSVRHLAERAQLDTVENALKVIANQEIQGKGSSEDGANRETT